MLFLRGGGGVQSACVLAGGRGLGACPHCTPRPSPLPPFSPPPCLRSPLTPRLCGLWPVSFVAAGHDRPVPPAPAAPRRGHQRLPGPVQRHVQGLHQQEPGQGGGQAAAAAATAAARRRQRRAHAGGRCRCGRGVLAAAVWAGTTHPQRCPQSFDDPPSHRQVSPPVDPTPAHASLSPCHRDDGPAAAPQPRRHPGHCGRPPGLGLGQRRQ